MALKPGRFQEDKPAEPAEPACANEENIRGRSAYEENEGSRRGEDRHRFSPVVVDAGPRGQRGQDLSLNPQP